MKCQMQRTSGFCDQPGTEEVVGVDGIARRFCGPDARVARGDSEVFDADAYVWRDRATGRELTADEVEAVGYDAGLRDSPEVWAELYRREA